MGVVVAIIVPVVSGVLGLIGFSSTGPVAGSMAAGIQSICYGSAVAKGSTFALAQSIAMTPAVL